MEPDRRVRRTIAQGELREDKAFATQRGNALPRRGVHRDTGHLRCPSFVDVCCSELPFPSNPNSESMSRYVGALIAVSLLFHSGLSAQDKTRENRNVKSFHSLTISGSFVVHLREGVVPEVIVVARGKEHEGIRVEQNGDELRIDAQIPDWGGVGAELYITANQLQYLNVQGAVQLKTSNTLRSETLGIDCGGASEIELLAECHSIHLECHGASRALLKGQSQQLNTELSGAASVDAVKLQADRATIEMSGASEARLRVVQKLQADLSGAAALKLLGKPLELVQNLSGAAQILYL